MCIAKSITIKTMLNPKIKYGLSLGLLLSASKNLVIPIAELGPPPAVGLFFLNFTIKPPFLNNTFVLIYIIKNV